jgi:hypothetical protein
LCDPLAALGWTSLHVQWGTGYWTTVGDCEPWQKEEEAAAQGDGATKQAQGNGATKHGATPNAESNSSESAERAAFTEKMAHLAYLVR